MREVVLLGTGTPVPDPARCGSGVALVGDDGGWILVDCGRGVTHRALEAGLDLGSLLAVLLTHHHSDHVSDLSTLAITRWVGGAPGLCVIAPDGPAARHAASCLDTFEDESFHGQARRHQPNRPSIEVHRFGATDTLARVPDDASVTGGWVVESILVDHHPIEAAVGYRVGEGDHVIAVSGDTAVCRGVERLADHVDLLVHEALDDDRSRPEALSWNAGARTVGALASRTGVRSLVLTHLLPVPATDDDERRFEALAREGGFAGPIVVARDLLRLPLDA